MRPDGEAALFFRRGVLARDEASATPARAEDALAAFSRASAIAPRFARAAFEAAKIRRGKGALEKALALAGAAITANPYFTDALALRGEVGLQLAAGLPAGTGGRSDIEAAARADFQAAVAASPGRLDVRLGLARALFATGGRRAAKEELDRIDLAFTAAGSEEQEAADAKLRTDVYVLRAQVARSLGEEDLARADERRAEDCRRSRRAIAVDLVRQAQALARENRLDEARKKYTAAIEADSTYAPAWYERGAVQNALRLPLFAALDTARGLELDPKYAEPVFNQALGGVARGEVDFDFLLPQVEEAIAKDPEDTAALFLRGLYRVLRVYLGQAKAGEAEGGIADLDRVIHLSPRHAFAYVCRAYLKQRQNDLPGAAADVALAERLDDRGSLAPYVEAVIAARRGDAAAAAEALERAIGRGFTSPERIQEEKAFDAIRTDARWKAAVAKIARGA
jgi:hypothetical protein